MTNWTEGWNQNSEVWYQSRPQRRFRPTQRPTQMRKPPQRRRELRRDYMDQYLHQEQQQQPGPQPVTIPGQQGGGGQSPVATQYNLQLGGITDGVHLGRPHPGLAGIPSPTPGVWALLAAGIALIFLK